MEILNIVSSHWKSVSVFKMTNLEEIMFGLAKYPFLEKALGPYVKWALTQTEGNGARHKIVQAITSGNYQALSQLESLLIRAQTELNITEDEFIKAFGFLDDLFVDDPEKLHDVIAEPLLVVKLTEHGFSEIKKLSKSIRVNGIERPLADFTAKRSGLSFAIELKTVRTEKTLSPGQPSGNALQPDWWGEMFLHNARMKVEGKDFRVVKQLKNACEHFDCDMGMLVLYSRRLGVAALSEDHEYREKLEILKAEYPQIDFFASMDYYGVFVMVPDLP